MRRCIVLIMLSLFGQAISENSDSDYVFVGNMLLDDDCKIDGYFVNSYDCNRYFVCSNGARFDFKCANELYFDQTTNTCNWAYLVLCNKLTTKFQNLHTQSTEAIQTTNSDENNDNQTSSSNMVDGSTSDDNVTETVLTTENNEGNNGRTTSSPNDTDEPLETNTPASDDITTETSAPTSGDESNDNPTNSSPNVSDEPLETNTPNTSDPSETTNKPTQDENNEISTTILPGCTLPSSTSADAGNGNATDDSSETNLPTSDGNETKDPSETIPTTQEDDDNKKSTTELPSIAQPTSNPPVIGNENCKLDGYFTNPKNCNRFFVCYRGARFDFKCAGGLYFDETISTCNWPHLVDCNKGTTKLRNIDGYQNSGHQTTGLLNATNESSETNLPTNGGRQ